MRAGFGRRLIPVSTLAIGALLVGTVAAIALFAFGAFADHVRGDADSLLEEAAATARSLPPRGNAIDAAHRVATRFIQPALIVVFADTSSRVTVLRDGGAVATRARVAVRARDDRSVPEAHGAVARLTLGLATAFGIQTLRAHAGRLDINVETNQPLFVEDVRSFLPAIAIALLGAIGIAVAAGRVLSRSAMRPLVDVTRALAKLSDGDFTREVIEPDGSAQLGALAVAYNGAVEQVERAFAERARANAVMRRFIADGGHQLRTPLTVIRGFVGILRAEMSNLDASEIDHILTSMSSQAALMSSLIDELILLERWEYEGEVRPRVVDVAELVREVVEPLALAHPGRTMRVETSAAAFVRVDESDVRHAVSNVLDNALKYARGDVDVTVRNGEERVEIAVCDGGPGMSAESAKRAFDRFFRGERRDVHGSGLGLAIAKRAIERSHGIVTLESSEAAGTRVAFIFPALEPAV